MTNKNLNKYANRLVNAFLKNRIISPLPVRYTKKISEAQKLRKLCESKIKIPVSKRVIPPIFEIKFMFFLKFLENNKNLWIKYPDNTKGIAKPKE